MWTLFDPLVRPVDRIGDVSERRPNALTHKDGNPPSTLEKVWFFLDASGTQSIGRMQDNRDSS